MSGGERELLAVWDRLNERAMWQRAADKARQTGQEEHLRVAEREIARLADVTGMDALQAVAELIELLTGRRWIVMLAAREEGASWDEIGATVGMTGQDAEDWYRHKIANQELYLGTLYDAGRARAVLSPGQTA
jgi:hypothetical protein